MLDLRSLRRGHQPGALVLAHRRQLLGGLARRRFQRRPLFRRQGGHPAGLFQRPRRQLAQLVRPVFRRQGRGLFQRRHSGGVIAGIATVTGQVIELDSQPGAQPLVSGGRIAQQPHAFPLQSDGLRQIAALGRRPRLLDVAGDGGLFR